MEQVNCGLGPHLWWDGRNCISGFCSTSGEERLPVSENKNINKKTTKRSQDAGLPLSVSDLARLAF